MLARAEPGAVAEARRKEAPLGRSWRPLTAPDRCRLLGPRLAALKSPLAPTVSHGGRRAVRLCHLACRDIRDQLRELVHVAGALGGLGHSSSMAPGAISRRSKVSWVNRPAF